MTETIKYTECKHYNKDLLLVEIERIFYNFLSYLLKMTKNLQNKFNDFNFIDQLKLIRFSGTTILYIDFEHLLYFSEELSDLIQDQYARIENSLKNAMKQFFKKIFYEKSLKKVPGTNFLRIGFYNLPNWNNFKTLGNYNYGKLLCTMGNIVRVVEPEPKLIFGIFACLNVKCKNKIEIAQTFIEYSEPKICPSCKSSDSWEIVIEDSLFIEVQKIRIQDISMKNVKKEPFLIFDAFLVDDATNLFNLGDRCVFTGYMIPVPLYKISLINKYLNLEIFSDNFSLNLVSGSLFYQQFLVNHIFCIKDNLEPQTLRLKSEFFLRKRKTQLFKKYENKKVLTLKNWSFFTKKLETFFVKYNEKHENLRIGILLMLLGGVDKTVSNNQLFRGDINISVLYCSDLILRNIFREAMVLHHEIRYTNGLTSSVGGLIGTIVKDFEKNSLFIDSGLFNCKNKNFYFVENFHYLDHKKQKTITDCMEKQKFVINKAEIKLTIKSKISILGMSEFSPQDNIDPLYLSKISFFQKNLLGKFDLNFFFPPENNIKVDFFNSKENISSYGIKKCKQKSYNLWSIQLYLSFARNISPLISTKTYVLILKIYLYLKRIFSFQKEILSEISSRHLETLIRMSEAFGKLTLSYKVQEFHVKASARTLFKSLYFRVFLDFKHKETREDLKNKHKIISYKDYEKAVTIKFRDFNFMARKIFIIIENKTRNKEIGGFLLSIIQKFFFYFSKSTKKVIGAKRIRKFIKTLKHTVNITKKIFIIKLSETQANLEDGFILCNV